MLHINDLNMDVILHVLTFLTDKNKLNFMMTCTYLYQFISCVKYNNFQLFDKIRRLSFRNNFRKIIYFKEIKEHENKNTVFVLKSNYDKIPPGTTCIKTGYHFNFLEIGIIPERIISLEFCEYFNHTLKKGHIPKTVTHLTINNGFRHMEKGSIPNSVTHLIFGDSFNKVIDVGVIPNSVVYLKFGWYFNQSIKNIIPPNIKYLSFRCSFNQPISEEIYISDTLKTISYIPESVKYFNYEALNDKFDFKILSENITYLNLKIEKHIYPGDIPSSVTRLGLLSNEDIRPGVIPDNVTHLSFNLYYSGNYSLNQLIHKNITHLDLGDLSVSCDRIPNGVTHLTYNPIYLTINSIPNSVTHLTIDSKIKGSINKYIPNSVVYLNFNGTYDNIIYKGDIPDNVRCLTFGNDFDQYIEEGAIPNSVVRLIFGKLYNKPINNVIPNNVKNLTFGYEFNQPIENAIPNSTNHIEFGYMFKQSLINSIPYSVTRLIFNYGLKSVYKINKKFMNNIPKTVSVILFK